SSCRVLQQPDAETIEKIGGSSRLPSDGQWAAGLGCDQCGQSGYKGRIAIHEVLAVNDEVRELISGRAAEHAIRRAAQQGGMRPLLDDGIDKAARGLTTLTEVLRVVSHGDPSGRVVADPLPVPDLIAAPQHAAAERDGR